MSNTSKIIICATPIGNLSDVSNRLIQTLKDVDVIFAEDTRVTSKLLNYFDIKTPIKRLDENLMDKNAQLVINEAKSGKLIAYCSDAGMPGVSDPGLKLVSAARASNIEVEVLPGPTAAISAYVLSGFTNQNFYFGSFLPRKSSELKQKLIELSKLDAVLIFYESPNRLISALKGIAEVLPDLQISVARELTKIHEEVVSGNSIDVYRQFESRESIKGEIVICINSKGVDEKSLDFERINSLANKLYAQGLKSSAIAEILCDAFDISKNEAKKAALDAKK